MVEKHVTRGYGILESFLAKLRIRKVNDLLNATHGNGKLLDIGCGPLPLFLMKATHGKKYGLDKVVRGRRGEAIDRKLNIIHYDLEQNQFLPFQHESFEVVTMLAVIEHIPCIATHALIREVERILKPGGIFVITTPPIWTNQILKMMAKLKLLSPIEIADHKELYNRKKIERLLQAGGFDRKRIRTGYFELHMNLWATARKELAN